MSGAPHPPADPETVAWNQAREAEWLAGRAAARQAKDALWAAANALEVMLRGLVPAVFHDPPVPLQIGTSYQLIALLEGEAEPETVRRFLRGWTSRSGYLQALARGGPRYDLDGHPAGEAVTQEQRDTAARRLAGRGVAL